MIVGDHTALGDGNVNLGLSLVTSKESWYILFIDVFLLLFPPNKISIFSLTRNPGLFGI